MDQSIEINILEVNKDDIASIQQNMLMALLTANSPLALVEQSLRGPHVFAYVLK